MTSVAFRSAYRAYRGVAALDHLDLIVEERSFTVLCGPPKSGKSVLFRTLVGLEQLDDGRIELGGQDITHLPPALRPIGYVPQSFALYPHLTVFANIAYPLTLAHVKHDEISRRVDRAAGILSIRHLLKKTPDQLSGGEKQRTAVARGLLKNATLFVLDDPLVGLDYKLRERLMDDLKSLKDELKATFLYATSDSLEALTMAQYLVVLDRGRVVQHDVADRVYHDPHHLRSLELIGFPRANLLSGEARADGSITAGPLIFRPNGAVRTGPATIGFRPEALKLDSHRAVRGHGRIQLVENLGGEFVVHLEAQGFALVTSFPASESGAPAFGNEMAFSIDPDDIVLFDPTNGSRLSPCMMETVVD